MTPDFTTFLQNILSNGASIGAPVFTNKKSGFKLDDNGKIKVNPLTGEKIKAGDRRSFKRFKRNPGLMSAATSLDFNLPDPLGLSGGGGGGFVGGGLGGANSLASIIGSVGRLK